MSVTAPVSNVEISPLVTYTRAVVDYMSIQLVSSLSPVGAILPAGQEAHEAASENGISYGGDTNGSAMYLPAGQQPSRPLLSSKTFGKVDHWPPHNVRLNPLY